MSALSARIRSSLIRCLKTLGDVESSQLTCIRNFQTSAGRWSATADANAEAGNQQAPIQEDAAWEARIDAFFGDKGQRRGGADGVFKTSPALAKALKEVENIPEKELVASIRRDLAADRRAHGKRTGVGAKNTQEPATDDDYRLLAETIDLYLATTPVADESVDGIGETEKKLLQGLGTVIKEHLTGEIQTDSTVVNTAPAGRLPWEVLAVDESIGTIHWACDLTEGRAKDPWRNARLSSAAKDHMYELHVEDPKKNSVEALAKMFAIRQQRVMAILALKEEEAKLAKTKPELLNNDLQTFMDEQVYFCNEATGSGERHYTILPSYPNYQEVDIPAVIQRLEAKLGKPADEITEEDLSAELVREVVGVPDQAQQEEEIAAQEEAQMVKEFKQRLDYNLGKTGASLSRANRRVHTAKRPEEGWSIVVTPLGDDADEAYVALPDGSKRELNEDEKLLKERKTPIPRRRVA